MNETETKSPKGYSPGDRTHATYLVLGLATGTITLKAVLVLQLFLALLTCHQHVQVADGELEGQREVRGFNSDMVVTSVLFFFF